MKRQGLKCKCPISLHNHFHEANTLNSFSGFFWYLSSISGNLLLLLFLKLSFRYYLLTSNYGRWAFSSLICPTCTQTHTLSFHLHNMIIICIFGEINNWHSHCYDYKFLTMWYTKIIFTSSYFFPLDSRWPRGKALPHIFFHFLCFLHINYYFILKFCKKTKNLLSYSNIRIFDDFFLFLFFVCFWETFPPEPPPLFCSHLSSLGMRLLHSCCPGTFLHPWLLAYIVSPVSWSSTLPVLVLSLSLQ